MANEYKTETNLKEFHSGDCVDFFIKNNVFDSSYQCKVIFVGNNKYEFTNSNYNGVFNFSINKTQSNLISKGSYKVFVLFYNSDFQKTEQLISINILENILTDNNVEFLSYNKKMLNAIEDRILERSRDDYESYTIGNRSIVKMKALELLKWRDYFAEKVQGEENYKNGVNNGNKLKVRWVGRFDS